MRELLSPDSIVLGGAARTRDEAITEAGQLLVQSGSVEPSYLDAMHEREKSVSTLMGNGLAIPHGTNEAKSAILRSAISFVRYDEPIDWKGQPAEFVVGVAGAGNDHLTVLQALAGVFTDESKVSQLRAARTAQDVIDLLDREQS